MSEVGYIFLFVLLSVLGVVAQTTPNLLLPKEIDDPILLDITDLAKNYNKDFSYELLSVYVVNDYNTYDYEVAVQGQFTVAENNLIFKPYFPFEGGLPYVVKLNSDIKEKPTFIPFQIGEKETVNQAKVLSIFPTSDLLPENVLRFYIYFQTPMKQEEALQHIKLLDKNGKVDNHAFMKFKEELWSSDGKRLTILFDPGRIKRGVSTNVVQGPALESGRNYQLFISGEWQDVYGHTLLDDKIKALTIIKGYRDKIEVSEWILDKPKYNTLNKLTIEFDRIIDHALMQTMMQLRDEEQTLISGYWEILENEKSVQFIPSKKWKIGNYILRFDARLEDIAGNNLQNLLDHNIRDKDLNDLYQNINFIINITEPINN